MSSLWLILTMKGILWAYLRATMPRTPKVEATALQPPSMASFDDVLAVEVLRVLGEGRAGGVLDALVHGQDGDIAGAAEAAGVQHAGEVASTPMERSELIKTRSTKSAPGRCRRDGSGASAGSAHRALGSPAEVGRGWRVCA
jgi:hypothetical protein